MDTLPQWDGVDRVTPLAQRISKKAFWIHGFHRWMLGMAAQWAGRMDRCAKDVYKRQGQGSLLLFGVNNQRNTFFLLFTFQWTEMNGLITVSYTHLTVWVHLH